VKTRSVAGALLAVVIATICASLGIWQLERLAARRALNQAVLARLNHPAVELDSSTAGLEKRRFQRVILRGRLDYDNEIVLSNRSRNGSPGVHIITPVRLPGRDTAVLVNRGWVYAPDAMTVDLARWREPAEISGKGYVELFPNRRSGANQSPTHPNAYRWLDADALRGRIPYPIAPYYVVLTTKGPPDKVPARVGIPDLDEGPHLSYAIQWFSFAAISIIGMIVLLRRMNGGDSASASQ